MHKCTEFDFGCGSTPDPTERAYSATLDPVAGFNGPTFKGWEVRKKRERRAGEGEKEGKGDHLLLRRGGVEGGGKGMGKLASPPSLGTKLRPCHRHIRLSVCACIYVCVCV